MHLKFIKEKNGIYNKVYAIGETITYCPWDYEWQGMSEKERVSKGIFIHCHGMGEFERFDENQDVVKVVI